MILAWILIAAAVSMLAAALGSFGSAYVKDASLSSVDLWYGYARLSAAIGLASLGLWRYWFNGTQEGTEASTAEALGER